LQASRVLNLYGGTTMDLSAGMEERVRPFRTLKIFTLLYQLFVTISNTSC